MDPTRILYVSSEITPYLPESEIATMSRYLAQGIQEKGREIRSFMPRYGCINERRNQLHEVIRLSGMNLIIDDTDHPLVIKVASIPMVRMQVYFIDNEDYFQRKTILYNSDMPEMPEDDNDERSVFFIRGVLETVKKLRWKPNIVHCHGWFSALLPFFLKKAYKDDPLFAKTKIILSLYNDEFENVLNNNIKNKIVMDGIKLKDLDMLTTPSYKNIIKLAIQYSDGIAIGSPSVNKKWITYAKSLAKPILAYQGTENYVDAYNDFYELILQS